MPSSPPPLDAAGVKILREFFEKGVDNLKRL